MKEEKILQTHGDSDMHALAKEVLEGLSPRADHATVIALHGDLGTGKTTFVQGLAQALGITDHVQSPTFVIERVYNLKNAPFHYLVHVDTYRLKDSDDLRVISFEDRLKDPNNLVAIEWADRVLDLIPPDAVHIHIEHAGSEASNKDRRVTLNYGKKTGGENKNGE